MKFQLLVWSILCIGLPVYSQQKTNEADPWTTYMNPGKVHKLLEQYTGSFTAEISMWMSSDTKPEVVTIQSAHTLLLGGRFLEMKQTGNMMGMVYEGITTLGFNTSDQSMSMVTLTNMGTGTLTLTGPWNETKKTATLTGTMTDPVSKKLIKVKQIISFQDANTIVIENFDQIADKPERKSIQYKFTRSK